MQTLEDEAIKHITLGAYVADGFYKWAYFEPFIRKFVIETVKNGQKEKKYYKTAKEVQKKYNSL